MTTTPQDYPLRALRASWSTLAAPELTDFEGDLQASFIGPLRPVAPRGLGLVGLPRWYGKRFAPLRPGANALDGVNLLRTRDGRGLEETLPMKATIGPSLADGRLALVVAYPPDARLPWRWVRDEFRVWSPGTYLGMTFVDLPGARRAGGTPFMLTRAVP